MSELEQAQANESEAWTRVKTLMDRRDAELSKLEESRRIINSEYSEMHKRLLAEWLPLYQRKQALLARETQP